MTTREHLLETAGQVFAEKGFAAATGKEICERAGANAAAVVYHFGGMDGLYTAVLHEARSRLVTTEMLAAAVAGERDPKEKLESLIGLLVKTLAGPAPQTWAARVISREIVAPSKAFEEFSEKELQARTKILTGLLSELTGLPAEHPVVARGAVSLLSPFLMLLILSRRRLEHIFPAFHLRQDSVEEITQHMIQFVLAGLAAVARQAHESEAAEPR